MEKYDIYVEGVKEFSSVDEEEMLDITQALADEFYHSGYPHPDEIEIKYLGTDDQDSDWLSGDGASNKDLLNRGGLFLPLNR